MRAQNAITIPIRVSKTPILFLLKVYRPPLTFLASVTRWGKMLPSAEMLSGTDSGVW